MEFVVASMDWRSGKLHCEFQVNEIVRDARWLHSNQVNTAARIFFPVSVYLEARGLIADMCFI